MSAQFYSYSLPAVFVASLLLGGCGKEESRLDQSSKLSVLVWEEYMSPTALDGFMKESGARVSVTEVSNSEELMQTLASKPHSFDVVVADETTMGGLISLRLLAALDQSVLGIDSQEYEPFLFSPESEEGKYTIPYLWGLTALAGRSEVLKHVEPSWSLLWREDLRIALLDEPYDLMWVALLALGYDPSSASEAQIDEAAARLAKRFPDFARSMGTQAEILDKLEADEVDLVMAYNGDALTLIAEVPGIDVVVPREGAPLWLDSFAISRDAPNAPLAHRFIAYFAKPEISALSANELNYASPNRAALPMIDETLLGNRALFPGPEMIERCSFVRYPPEVARYAAQSMLRIISESRYRVANLNHLEEVLPASTDGLGVTTPRME